MVQAIEARTQDHERPAFSHDFERLWQAAFGQFS
jgi:hypothetical protein